MFTYRSDIWRPGILRAPIEACLEPASFPPSEIVWFPEQPPYRFLADPFGLWRDGRLHVLLEAYDYADKRGYLVRHVFDADLNWLGEQPAMRRPHHLSYPFLIEEGGETWMLPEAHRSGTLSLYRASADLASWTQAATLLDLPAVDASAIRVEGRWWLFFALAGPGGLAQETLHVAWADRLLGPWHLHPANPVLRDRAGARPGGTPIIRDGAVHLPTQDCRATYGAALRWLRVDELTPDRFSATPLGRLGPGPWSEPYAEGLHTLSGCGPVTLFDVKRVDRSPRRALVNLRRRWRRLTGR